MCCSPVTSVAFTFPSLPNILKSSLDSLSSSFILLQSIFYVLFLETACCKVINNPPVAKTNERLPVQSCTVPLGCRPQLLRETLPRQLQCPLLVLSLPWWLLLNLLLVLSPGLETQLSPMALSLAFFSFPLCILLDWSHQVLWHQPFPLWLALIGMSLTQTFHLQAVCLTAMACCLLGTSYMTCQG